MSQKFVFTKNLQRSSHTIKIRHSEIYPKAIELNKMQINVIDKHRTVWFIRNLIVILRILLMTTYLLLISIPHMAKNLCFRCSGDLNIRFIDA